LNPLRAGLAPDIGGLDTYPWCGHGVLLNKSEQTSQNIDVEARALLCFWAHRKLGMSTIDIARRLKIGQPAASRLSKRGEQIEKENEFDLTPDKGLKT